MQENSSAPAVSSQSADRTSFSPSPLTGARVLAFVNQKGGTGKTTISQNLAICLATQFHKRVLCVDLDPLGNLGQGLSADPIQTTKTADRLLLVPSANISEYILKVRERVDLIPNRYQRDLRETVERLPAGENLLKRHLRKLQDQYDFVLIDTPAGMYRSTQIGVDTASEVIVVMSCSSYALKGTSEILAWVKDVSARTGSKGPAVRLILNNFDERKRFDRDFREEAERLFGEALYQTQIRTSVRIVEAAAQSKGVVEYQPVSQGATDFKRLSREVLGLPLIVSSFSNAASEQDKEPLADRRLKLVS